MIHYREVSLVGSECDRHAAESAARALCRRARADHRRRGSGRAPGHSRVRPRRDRRRVYGGARAARPEVRPAALGSGVSASEPRVALVTGGGRGIGRATAVAPARAGARVTVTARTHDEVAAVAAETGGDFIAASAATAEGCAEIVKERAGSSGPIDILVCCAGIGAWGEKPIWELSHERWRETLATNLDGPFYLSGLVTAGMTERGFGGHRLRQLDGRRGRRARPTGLLRVQARSDRADARDRAGRDPLRGDLQRRAARMGAYQDGRRRRGRGVSAARAARARKSGPRTPPSTQPDAYSTPARWQPRSRSSARMRPVASTARRSASRSAASGSCDRAHRTASGYSARAYHSIKGACKRPPSTASHERGAPGRSPPAVADSAADTPTPPAGRAAAGRRRQPCAQPVDRGDRRLPGADPARL